MHATYRIDGLIVWPEPMEAHTNLRKSPRPTRRQSGHRRPIARRILTLALVALLAALAAILFLSRSQAQDDQSVSKKAVLELWQKSDWSGIRRLSDKALVLHPLDAFYLGTKGIASFYDAMGIPEGGERDVRLGEAIVSIRKALAAGSANAAQIPRAQLEYVLAKVYYHVGGSDMDLAAEYLASAEAHGYKAADIHIYLAMIQSALGNAAQALREFDAALAQNSSPMLSIAAASASLKAGNIPKAEALLKDALAATQDAVAQEKARLLLAQIYFNASRFDESEKQLAALIAANPESAEAHFQLGLVYQAKGDSIHARSEWRRAVSIDPMHAGARQKLAERS